MCAMAPPQFRHGQSDAQTSVHAGDRRRARNTGIARIGAGVQLDMWNFAYALNASTRNAIIIAENRGISIQDLKRRNRSEEQNGTVVL